MERSTTSRWLDLLRASLGPPPPPPRRHFSSRRWPATRSRVGAARGRFVRAGRPAPL